MTSVHPDDNGGPSKGEEQLQLDDYGEKPKNPELPLGNTTPELPPYEAVGAAITPTVIAVQPANVDGTPVITTQPQTHTLQPPAAVQSPPQPQVHGLLMQHFDPAMYDPISKELVHGMASVHKSHRRLEGVINTNAQSMYQTSYQQYHAQHDNLSYEQLLNTLLFEGEQLLLGGQYIYYTSVVFLDASGKTSCGKPSMTKGRAFVTTKRLLLLSAEDASVTKLTKAATLSKKCNTYQLVTSLVDSMYIQSIPMEGFRSVDLNAGVGVQTETTIRGEKPECSKFCEGICCCFKGCCTCCEFECCMKQWSADYPSTTMYSERYVTIGTLMPPWAERMMVRIHFDQSMGLAFINAFLVEMQRHATNLNRLDLAPPWYPPPGHIYMSKQD